METLQQTIAALVAEHGQDAVQEALTAAGTVPPKCPTGYYWNGTMCVLNVGN